MGLFDAQAVSPSGVRAGSGVAPDRVVAFAPGRVNLIGEHTDYNDGLSLAFAVEQGIRVTARAVAGEQLVVRSAKWGEEDRFALRGGRPRRTNSWRDFVRGTTVELTAAGYMLPGAELEIQTSLPAGAGLSSSGALEVALVLALLALSGVAPPPPLTVARLCARVEREWLDARTGLLDQLASLLGASGHAVRIDFRSLCWSPVGLSTGDWRLVTLDSGQPRSVARSGYNQRRAECERACALLGLDSLRQARPGDLAGLPEPLDRRVRHVLDENARVDATVRALARGQLAEVGRLLGESHRSLRDLYDASTGPVERTVSRLARAGAAGARMMGAGFGGHVLALLSPETEIPPLARLVSPGSGARVLEVR